MTSPPNQPTSPVTSAAISQPSSDTLILSGSWTARGISAASTAMVPILGNTAVNTAGDSKANPLQHQLESIHIAANTNAIADGTNIDAMDTAGAWLLQKMLLRLRGEGSVIVLENLQLRFQKLLDVVATQVAEQATKQVPTAARPPTILARVGIANVAVFEEALALLAFIGQNTLAFASSVKEPARIRWRPILFNIRSAGFDALPIVGLLSFLLGIVVAYQGADQLRQYGANIFIADLVGLSMLREFAPLITAIIIAGRSGSAYAAQIGTMTVTEEIDAMRTIGIAPLELLVLPKVIALVIAMPLLTLFADVLGVSGGMIMARVQLGVSYSEFLDRFVKAVSTTSYLVGIGKAPVFAFIIALVGCFQGFRTKGGADSVGRQTTRSVVQSIFLVIVADALFSIAFSALDL